MNLYTVIIAICASLGGLLSGYDMGVISGALLYIKEAWNLDANIQGLIVSSAVLGCFIGVLLNGFLSDLFGRKKIIFLTSIIFLLGSILSAISPNSNILILSRVIAGFGVGMATFVVPLYLSEISPKKIRGAFVSLFQLSLTFGILFAYLINYLCSSLPSNWRMMLGIGVIPSLVLLFSTLFIKDSPRWLFVKGRKDEAQEIFRKLKMEDELEELKTASDKEEKLKLEKWLIKPLLLGIGIMFVQICTGINTIIYYAPTIFQFGGFTEAKTALGATISVGIINFLMTFVAIFFSDKIGRKPLIYSGLSIMLLSMGLLGLLFYTPQIFGAFLKPLIVLSVLLYISAFSFSLGPVTFILISEIFPTKFRGFLMSISLGANFIFNFIVVYSFLPLVNKIGEAKTFWLFSLICLTGIIYYMLFIPETKGVALEEIEEKFRKIN